MRSAILATALAISTFSFSSQQKAPPVPPSRIEGVVVDGMNSKPVAGVTVTMLQASSRNEVTTDATGRFAFTIPHGTVRLTTAKMGYASVRPEGHQLPTDGVLISVAALQQLRGLSLTIWPTGSISATVYDSRAKAVPFAQAELLRYTYDEDGVRVLRQAGSAHPSNGTTERGEFRIEQIDPGEYYLQIQPPLLAERVPGEPFTALRPMPVTIKSGAETHLEDLTLPSGRGGTIRIHLTNQTGQSLQNTMSKYLHWTRRGDTGMTTVVPMLIMGGPERAEIPVPPGTYAITAGWTAATNRSEPIGLGTKVIDVNQGNVDVDMVVTKGVRLSGHAFVEQAKGPAKPLAGVRCELTNDTLPGAAVTSAADGSLSIENIQPALYRIRCSTPNPDTFVTGIQQADRDALKDEIQIASGQSPEFTVTLSQAGGIVEGKIFGDKSQKIAGAIVALVPDGPLQQSKHLYRVNNADQNGAFSIRAVAPGAYHVFAWTELEGATYKNDAFMQKYADQGTPVTISASETKTGVQTKLLQ